MEAHQEKLDFLIQKYPELKCQSEAETRFHFIDSLLIDCLSWDRDKIKIEGYESGSRTDYELGEPKVLIVEAKRDNIVFNLPVRMGSKFIAPLESICGLCRFAREAIEQVQQYCAVRGVKYAVVCNGCQLIAFVAVRVDGKSPLKGGAFIIDGFDQLKSNFDLVFQLLSSYGIAENKLSHYLDAELVYGIPERLSMKIPNYPSFRYQNESSNSLRLVAELLLEDISKTHDLEKRFYEECYCDSGALAQDALIGKNILRSRYAALFSPDEVAPLLAPVRKRNETITSDVIAESLSKRPIILIGDVGVGKTSFLRNLILIGASEEFKKSIWIYLDLGISSFLSDDIKIFVALEIEAQLKEKYSINVNDNDFVKNIYRAELLDFERGIYRELKVSNPEKYLQKQLDRLEELIGDKERHLKRVIAYISKEMKKQTIIIVDNVDQRELAIQQNAFIVSQAMAQQWGCVVFLSVRPNTFHQSKRSGSLSAYTNKIFYIMPPRAEFVLEKRLIFALNIAEGRLPIESLSSVSLNLETVSQFIKALLSSIQKNVDVSEFLSNITGGNVRSMIDFVTKFIGSPNVDSDKIISIQRSQGRYIIPLHEFSKSALLGDYSHYEPISSLAMNLFDVRFPDRREHFLSVLILGYLNYDSNHRNGEGLVGVDVVRVEIQSLGFTVDQMDNAIRRLTNKKLIEMTRRVTFEESVGRELMGEVVGDVRITTIGAYHLCRWCGTFSYIDAMLFDTPIFDNQIRDSLIFKLKSFEISDRYDRSIAFRDYLISSWRLSNID
ncbi:hypothetical protein [Chromobacterium phragmitis]|uniref:hypothetical protein n=1 Tax=Chromobacterium phragmitis TaxID=2202141 RepID=UPI003877F9F6